MAVPAGVQERISAEGGEVVVGYGGVGDHGHGGEDDDDEVIEIPQPSE